MIGLRDELRILRFVTERFMATPVKTTNGGCCEWGGPTWPSGYGGVVVPSAGRIYTHRLAVLLDERRIPDGAWICHDCDNPPCCNPQHLYVGDALSNARDRERRGRGRRRGARNRIHADRLSESDIQEIRRLRSTGMVQRVIAERYGISQPDVSRIVNHKTWTDVPEGSNR